MGKLTDAVESNNLKEVQRLLAKEYKNSKQIDGELNKNRWSSLLIAASHGFIDIMLALIKVKANVNQVGNNGTPLYMAAQNGHTAAIEVLLNAKENANVNQADNYGRTPLWIAASGGHTETIGVLLTAGANVNQANTHGQPPLYEIASTPLYIAAQNGHTATVEALVKAKANVNQADTHGRTPLYVAAFGAHTVVIEMLIRAGANVNLAKNDNGETPLYLVAQKGLAATIEALVKAGAKVNQATTHGGYTPLHMAASGEHTAAIEALVKAGANVNQVMVNGTTALFWAALSGRTTAIEALLKAGAKVNQTNGTTPLCAATQSGRTAAVELLLKAGADVNQVNDGTTPLCTAAQYGHVAMIQPLLNAGADVTAKVTKEGTEKDKTPLDIAKKRGHTEIVRLLEIHIEKQKNVSNMALLNTQFNETQKLLDVYRKTSGADSSYLAGMDSFLKDILIYSQSNSSALVTSGFAETLKNIEEQQNKLHLLIKPKPPLNTPKYKENTKVELLSPLLPDKANAPFSFTLKYNELEIGKVLGRGAFGVVHEGTYRYNKVAIKQLHLTQPSKEALQDFKQEMQLMANLRCPQIVQLYGVYTEPSYGIVMEYMPMGSLYNVLRNSEPLDWTVRASIAMDITKGVAFLHSENILHRDLKSLNVLLDEQMKAKLTDFGLAKIKNETTGTSSSNNQAVGTLLWMAPELFQSEDAKCTPKSDMYSLGMTLWELASRKKPFEKAINPMIAAQWVQQGKQEKIPEDCPPNVSKLITFCWNAEAERRPSADEAVKQLLSTELKQEQEDTSNFSYRGNFDSGLK